MKKILPSAFLRTAVAALFCLLLQALSFHAQAQQPAVYQNMGSLCTGSGVSFYFSGGSGCYVTSWSVSGYDYTIVSQSSSSITVRWNSAQSGAGVSAYYNGCYDDPYYGSVSSPFYTISASKVPAVSLNQNNPNTTPGQSVSFQATPVNGGASPSYSWYVNGSYVAGGSSSTYSFSQSVPGSYTVTCYLYSSEACASGSGTASTTVTVAEPLAAPYAFGNVLMATLPNGNITASACWDGCEGGNHESWRGRLFDQGFYNWSAGANDQNQYLQVDLGEVRQVEGIITQGRHNCCPQWVTSYTLSYSSDGNTWTNHPQAFTGNTDMQTPVARTISSPFAARYVRIRPTGWNEHITMRAEIVSVPFGRSSVTFAASQPTGADSNRWYEAATGGNPIHTGTSYTVTLPADKTFYVSAYNTANGVESATRTAVLGKVKLLGNTTHAISNTVNVKGVKTTQQVYTLPVGSDRGQEVAYLNRLGMPSQQVATQGSSAKKDIVVMKKYDDLNREATQYLPYTSGTDGKFKIDAATAQPSFYLTAKADSKAFAESRFEASPLGRVVEQSAPGTPWQLAATPEAGKTTKVAYGRNAASEVRIWNYSLSTKTATGTLFYPANALYVTQTTDEHGLKSLEYKDKSGQVVCTKVQQVLNDETSYLWSYSVYDDFGSLRFVISPEAVSQLAAVNYTFAYNDAFCRRWLFAYQYDERWRATEKSVPGGGITFMVYDPSDRPVLTQDAAEYAGRQWKFIKYDALGREIMAGRYTHTAQVTQAQMQQAVDAYYAANTSLKDYESRSNANYAAFHGYTNQAFPLMPSPNSASGQPDLVSYYDDYDFDYSGVAGETAKGEPAYVNLGSGFETVPGRTKGKATGTRMRVLGTGTWLLSAVFYDAEGRAVQMQQENYNTAGIVPATTGRTLEVVGTQYDFAGKVLKTEQRHLYAVTGGTSSLTLRQRFVYDHAGRVKEQYQQVNSEAEQRLAAYAYSELGELVSKVVGAGAGLQTMDYKYNMRGWLKSINDGALNGTDIFAMGFAHEENAVGPQYNGNISKFDWISKTDNVRRTYQFGYDGLNRMLSGTYSATAAAEQFSVNNISYDNNGNLKSMHRQNLLQRKSNAADQFGFVDQLQYTHDGNRLTAVEDALHATAAQAQDFPDKSRTDINATEYFYDAAGRLTADKNKGITSIVYNELGLPAVIYLGSSNYLTNVYDATGAKLQTTVTKGGSTASTQKYIGGVVYRNDVPQFMATAEGRMLSPQAAGTAAWVYEYHYRDHLGSLRVAFRQPQNISSTASMEPASDVAWSNAGSPVRNSERASSGTYSAKLTTTNPLGPWKTVKVNKGDIITVSARGSYTQAPSNNSAVDLIPYVNALPAQTSESGNIPARLSLGLAVVPLAGNSVQSTVPKAYLQYILQTADEAVTQSRRQYLTVAANSAWESLSLSYTAETEGYLQVLAANESDRPVWFDEVKLTVQPGLIVQETHYDPWGLELAGIEGRGSPEHPHKFQGKELIDELDLYLMDFHARYYDAQLGRWHAVDPADQFASPYLAMANNPVVSVDPDGEFVPLVIGGVAALIGGGQNLWSNWSKVKDFKTGLAYFGAGAVGGAVSVANPLLGGSLTVTANIAIDLATGNMPDMSNPGDVAKYAGFKALEGVGAAGAGTLAKGAIGLTKLAANSLTNWTYNSAATAVAGKGTMYGARVLADVTVTATKVPVVPLGSLAAAAGNAAKGGITIVGEGMKRVSMEAAKHPGSVILNNMPKFTGTADQITSQMMTYNRKWILQQMRSGRPILDIGLDPTRGAPSIFYQMEQNMIKNYLKLHPGGFQLIGL